MLAPDCLAACVPGLVKDVVVLPDTCRLSLSVEWKHPEHFIEQVEIALPKEWPNFLSPKKV
jgi:hypothetical protein